VCSSMSYTLCVIVSPSACKETETAWETKGQKKCMVTGRTSALTSIKLVKCGSKTHQVKIYHSRFCLTITFEFTECSWVRILSSSRFRFRFRFRFRLLATSDDCTHLVVCLVEGLVVGPDCKDKRLICCDTSHLPLLVELVAKSFESGRPFSRRRGRCGANGWC
jgi:hypothetical protein